MEVIHKVYFLVKKRGCTLQGAKEQLKIFSQIDENITSEIIQLLERIKSFLCDIRGEITQNGGEKTDSGSENIR